MASLPELLAPAGDFPRLETVLRYGADAVYLGGPDLSLRAQAAGFDEATLPEACRLARRWPRGAHGVRVYYTLNLLPQPRHMEAVAARLRFLDALPEDASPHALIIADPGVLRLARQLAPRYPIHLSTQANTTNPEAIAFWKEAAHGAVTRVNLARELDGRAVVAMTHQARALNMETECFVHGAQCMAVSGRCLLGAALDHAAPLGGARARRPGRRSRSANLGECAQPCRYEYRVHLEERLRPGHPTWELPVEPCGEGAHAAVLAAEDLCLIHFVWWFAAAGVASLKIEGRMRTEQALAQVVDAYRAALDGLCEGRMPGRAIFDELRAATTRPLTTGFLTPTPRRLHDPTTMAADRPALPGAVVAKVLAEETPGRWRLAVKGRFSAGDELRVLVPGLRRPFLGPFHLESEDGAPRVVAHSGTTVRLHSDNAALQSGLFLRLV